MTLPVKNYLLYEKLINLKSFVLNNKVTSHMSIMHPHIFNYFHTYSVLIYHYDRKGQEILPESYICQKENFNEIEKLPLRSQTNPLQQKIPHPVSKLKSKSPNP